MLKSLVSSFLLLLFLTAATALPIMRIEIEIVQVIPPSNIRLNLVDAPHPSAIAEAALQFPHPSIAFPTIPHPNILPPTRIGAGAHGAAASATRPAVHPHPSVAFYPVPGEHFDYTSPTTVVPFRVQ